MFSEETLEHLFLDLQKFLYSLHWFLLLLKGHWRVLLQLPVGTVCNGYRVPSFSFGAFMVFSECIAWFVLWKPMRFLFWVTSFFLVVPFFHLIVAENKDLGKSVEIPKLPDGILWVWNFNWKGGGLTCNSLFLRKLICCCSAVISWKEVGVDWDTWSNVDDRIKWFKFLSSKFWFGKCNKWKYMNLEDALISWGS